MDSNQLAGGVTAVESSDQPRVIAVVDIGSSSIRMAIAEIKAGEAPHTLESLSRPVPLGRDAFGRGELTKSTIEESVAVLTKFRQKLSEYSIDPNEDVRVVATSAVRESSNRLAFQDRIYIATGFVVEVLDEAEESRMTYMGVLPFLQADGNSERTMLVVEAGGGSTEVLAVRGHDVMFSQSFRLGSLRLLKHIESVRTPWGKSRSLMENEIRQTMARLGETIAFDQASGMISLGGDIRFAAKNFDAEWDGSEAAQLDTGALEKFVNELLSLSVDETVGRYGVSFREAESCGPALLINVELARMYGISKILVSNANLRDGIIKEMASGRAWTEELSQQVVRSAVDLGRKFHFDEKHARHVASLSLKLFEQTREIHQLDRKYDLVLYIGALLHELGLYVSNRAYHKHSMYLIRNSELFGFGERDLMLVSLVARYHRRNTPQPSHAGYATLDREHRIAVSKMASILRLAVALEHSRSRRISDVRCDLERGRLVITAVGVDDLSLEQIAMEQGSAMFEGVFGVSVLLRSEIQ